MTWTEVRLSVAQNGTRGRAHREPVQKYEPRPAFKCNFQGEIVKPLNAKPMSRIEEDIFADESFAVEI